MLVLNQFIDYLCLARWIVIFHVVVWQSCYQLHLVTRKYCHEQVAWGALFGNRWNGVDG